MKIPKLHTALKTLKRCLQPLTFAQENFHLGLQYLAVWRFGCAGRSTTGGEHQ